MAAHYQRHIGCRKQLALTYGVIVVDFSCAGFSFRAKVRTLLPLSYMPYDTALLQKALDAFWQVVATANPDITTGDISPMTAIAFDESAEAAIKEWLTGNRT